MTYFSKTITSLQCILLCFLILFFAVTEIHPVQDPDRPEVDIIAKGVLANGSEEEVIQLQVHEFLKTSFYALLNYVFFEEGDHNLPARYNLLRDNESTKLFNPQMQFLNWEILDVYWNILNITGYRLRQTPDETITLNGCNSNTGIEAGNPELSLRRAEAVKNYLTKVWKIAPERIKIAEPKNLPDAPSTSSDNPALSAEENRRVEITGSWEMLKPLVIQDTTRSANPPVIYFYSYINSKVTIRGSKITIMQKGENLRDPFYFNGPPRDVLRWRIKKEEIPSKDFPIIYRLFVKADLSGESPAKKINVEEYSLSAKKKLRMDMKEYSRYSLILFNFEKADLLDNHKKIINLIKDYEDINKSTKFYITGYSDETGPDNINLDLSDKRSQNTRSALLETGIEEKQIAQCKGLGESSSPYFKSAIEHLIVNQGRYIDPAYLESGREEQEIDYNRFPEGRFYCRTVVIEIENTVKPED